MRHKDARAGFERIGDAVDDVERGARNCAGCVLALVVLAFALGAGLWSMFTQLVRP